MNLFRSGKNMICLSHKAMLLIFELHFKSKFRIGSKHFWTHQMFGGYAVKEGGGK